MPEPPLVVRPSPAGIVEKIFSCIGFKIQLIAKIPPKLSVAKLNTISQLNILYFLNKYNDNSSNESFQILHSDKAHINIVFIDVVILFTNNLIVKECVVFIYNHRVLSKFNLLLVNIVIRIQIYMHIILCHNMTINTI